MADMDIGQTPKAIPMTYCVCARHVDSSGSLWLDACACVCVRSCRYLSVRHQKRQKLKREKKRRRNGWTNSSDSERKLNASTVNCGLFFDG